LRTTSSLCPTWRLTGLGQAVQQLAQRVAQTGLGHRLPARVPAGGTAVLDVVAALAQGDDGQEHPQVVPVGLSKGMNWGGVDGEPVRTICLFILPYRNFPILSTVASAVEQLRQGNG
jgi:hypothetical protein